MLVILEDGAKVPADLGGKIFVPFNDRERLDVLIEPVRAFLEAL